MNSLTISGRIGRDAELRTTAGGMEVLSFPVASSKKVKGEERTTWFECAIFGKRAQSLSNYIQKGGQIVVTGSCELDVYQKNDGTTGAKIKVMVNDVDLVGGRPPAPSQQQAPQQFQQAPQPQGFGQQPPQQQGFQNNAPQQAGGFDDSYIPFAQFERGTFA